MGLGCKICGQHHLPEEMTPEEVRPPGGCRVGSQPLHCQPVRRSHLPKSTSAGVRCVACRALPSSTRQPSGATSSHVSAHCPCLGERQRWDWGGPQANGTHPGPAAGLAGEAHAHLLLKAPQLSQEVHAPFWPLPARSASSAPAGRLSVSSLLGELGPTSVDTALRGCMRSWHSVKHTLLPVHTDVRARGGRGGICPCVAESLCHLRPILDLLGQDFRGQGPGPGLLKASSSFRSLAMMEQMKTD